MIDPEDIVDIEGLRGLSLRKQIRSAANASGPRCKFLSIWFRCCNVYGRMHRNKQQTAYEGRCPKCGAKVSARIGPGGTNRRMFEAR